MRQVDAVLRQSHALHADAIKTLSDSRKGIQVRHKRRYRPSCHQDREEQVQGLHEAELQNRAREFPEPGYLVRLFKPRRRESVPIGALSRVWAKVITS